MLKSLKTRLKLFIIENDSGAVVAEFAVAMAWLSWWYVFSFAAFDGFRQYNANIKATYTISDLISRQVIVVDEEFLNGLDEVYQYLISYRSPAELRFSSIKWVEADNRYEVHWSHSTGNRQDLVTDDLIEFLDRLPILVDGEHVLLVESRVTYRALFGNEDFPVGPTDGLEFNNFVVTSPRFAPRIDFQS